VTRGFDYPESSMAGKQVRSVVIRFDGPEYRTGWYAEGDPVIVQELTNLLRRHEPRAYLVRWETRQSVDPAAVSDRNPDDTF